jgi:hypothetical protein
MIDVVSDLMSVQCHHQLWFDGLWCKCKRWIREGRTWRHQCVTELVNGMSVEEGGKGE